MQSATVDQRIEARALALDALYQQHLQSKGILGLSLRQNPRFPSLVARVAKARGIDVGDDGRMRCPLNFTNGGEFTDLNMTNCGPQLSASDVASVMAAASKPSDALDSMREKRSSTRAGSALADTVTSRVLFRPSRVRQTDDWISVPETDDFKSRIKAIRKEKPRKFFKRPKKLSETIEPESVESDRYVRSLGLLLAHEAAQRMPNGAKRAELQAKRDAIDEKLISYFESRGVDFNVGPYKDMEFFDNRQEVINGVSYQRHIYKGTDNEGNMVFPSVLFPEEPLPSGASSDRKIEIKIFGQDEKISKETGRKVELPPEIAERTDAIIAAHERNLRNGWEAMERVYDQLDALPSSAEEFGEAAMSALEEAGVKRGKLTNKDLQKIVVMDQALGEALKDIAPFMPQAWLDSILDQGKNFMVQFDVSGRDRSFFRETDSGKGKVGTVVMAESLRDDPDGLRSTLLHEIMHSVQMKTNVGEAEFVFWNRVASKGNVAPLGGNYEDYEVGDPDDFDNTYIGKIYQEGENRPYSPREITPMLIQNLYGKSGRSFGGDNDSLYWLLGMMAEAGK